MPLKTCTACLKEKELLEFHVRRASADGRRPTCKPCTATEKSEYHQKNAPKIVAKVRAWRRANPGRKNASQRKHERKYSLKKLYGMTVEQYDALLKAQGGVCAICKGPPNGRRKSFHVDHDHATKQVRGLLCHNCNIAIGLMKDSPKRLRGAAAYLEFHSSAPADASIDGCS